jgi:hypothetical protein
VEGKKEETKREGKRTGREVKTTWHRKKKGRNSREHRQCKKWRRKVKKKKKREK